MFKQIKKHIVHIGLWGTYSRNKFILSLFVASWLVLTQTNCKKLIDVDPPFTTVNNENAFTNDATATAVVTDIMVKLIGGASSYGGDISQLFAYGGLASDELSLFSKDNSVYNDFYLNALTENSDFGFWKNAYYLIFSSNLAIEGLTSSTKLTMGVKRQLLGEAKFLRAFSYFYLVNLYGDIPLVLQTDALLNSNLSRSPSELVYQQIISDLKASDSLLSEDYRSGNVLLPTGNRLRPNMWAAKALLARVYLFHKDYGLSANLATEVINKTSLYHLDSLDNVFLTSSHESIWQLQNIGNTGPNTAQGALFILPITGPTSNLYPVYLNRFLVNIFEVNDRRRTRWIDSVVVKDATVLPSKTDTFYYSYKYKSGPSTANGVTTENETVLRLGEQYLIRAEARVEIGDYMGALEDLNKIRLRASLGQYTAIKKDSLLGAILHERQVELFTEWGHRWLDLKRTGNIDSVMNVVSPAKGGVWNSYKKLWPISLTELQADPYLTQNFGY